MKRNDIEEYAKNEIYSEVYAIMYLYGDNFSYGSAYEQFMDDFYDCYHVIEYKKKYADEWLKEKVGLETV